MQISTQKYICVYLLHLRLNEQLGSNWKMDTLTGAVERVTYYNPENGYSVVRLRPEGGHLPAASRDGLVTVTGNLPELAAGEYLRLSGKWVNHPKHGLQFQSEVCEQTLPATVAGIRRYLGSGLIKGIGPRLAERIVRQFGDQTLDVIEARPERLQEVPDIGPKRSGLIAAAWQEQKQVKEIMLFLHSYGVSTNLAVKIYKQYGDMALGVVRSDPYRLARDIFGVGFKTADRIAQSLGLAPDHPSRIEAGIIYALNEMTNDGHVFAPQPVLAERAAELLGVPPELIPPALERLAQDDRLRRELLPFIENTPAPAGRAPAVAESPAAYGQEAVYLTPLYFGETGVAERLRRLAEALPTRLSDLPPAFIALDPSLSAEQQSAIRTALSHPVSVLTGGPGTGKTTAIKALIAALEGAHKRYALASPTGRAARRLSEATERPASTIHRLLGYSPGEGFKLNAENPLPVDLLVVDEASMLELLLANHLLKALQPGTHLLLVGDVDQLPSVGAGDVLRDLIASGLAPVTRLSAIFRQAAGSQIILNAHRINQGQAPLFTQESGERPGDFFLFPAETPEEAGQWVQEVVCERIPKKFGLVPRQIQVLTPMYRGPAGVHALNGRLQQALNPPGPLKPEKSLFGQTFRLGDRVMQIQNNYDKEVYNGDIGSLVAFDPIEHTLTAEFDGRGVLYDWSDADQLVLAYAVSVHKAQGSEFPAVVIPLVTAHYMMLQRNLLYTAITRAKQLCVLVGSRRAIHIAVQNNKVSERYTALDWRLKQQQ
jgi:exodeoxyribonuclease V alpha subunit